MNNGTFFLFGFVDDVGQRIRVGVDEDNAGAHISGTMNINARTAEYTHSRESQAL